MSPLNEIGIEPLVPSQRIMNSTVVKLSGARLVRTEDVAIAVAPSRCDAVAPR